MGMNSENRGKLKAKATATKNAAGDHELPNDTMMSYLDELDSKFNLESIEEKDLQEIKDFINKRANIDNTELTRDGELTLDITRAINQHTMQVDGQIDDM